MFLMLLHFLYFSPWQITEILKFNPTFSKLCSELQKYKKIAIYLGLNVAKVIFYIRRTHFA